MKSVTNPATILLYDGRLARVIAIGEGRTIHMEFLDEEPCARCGRSDHLAVLEHSRLFQDHADPVETVVTR